MRVEVRRRSEFSRHGAGPSNPTIVEAYSDNCFETQTRFYTVAPDHPKLGKWSQPSTLKYGQQHPSDMSSHQSLNENAHPTAIRISSTRRSRPTCSSPPVVAHGLVGRSGTTTPTMMAASNGSICRSSRVRQRVQSRRTTRPVSPLCARSESPPPSTARGRQGEAPRIDTPISGRVAPLHQRSFQAFPLPSSPCLCGSFDQHQQTAVNSRIIIVPFDRTAPTHSNCLAEEGKGVLQSLPPATETTRPTSDSEDLSLRIEARREREEAEPQVEPEVRYRVRLEKVIAVRVGDKEAAGGGGTRRNRDDDDDGEHHTTR